MAIVTKANTYTADTKAKASEVNTNFDDIYAEFNGQIDEANLRYTSADSGVLVHRAGPNYAGTNGRRTASFISNAGSGTALSTGTTGFITITFSTDCGDGDPAFTTAPEIVVQAIINTTQLNEVPRLWISATSTTTATVRWERVTGTALTLFIHGFASQEV